MKDLLEHADYQKLAIAEYEELEDKESSQFISKLEAKSACGQLHYKKVIGKGSKAASQIAKMYVKTPPTQHNTQCASSIEVETFTRVRTVHREASYTPLPRVGRSYDLPQKDNWSKLIGKYIGSMILAVMALLFLYVISMLTNVIGDIYSTFGPIMGTIFIIIIFGFIASSNK